MTKIENLYSPHNSDSSSDKIDTKLYNKDTKNKLGSQLVSHVLNGATNFQRSVTCHVAFDKAGYCRHTCLPVSLTAWLTK